VEKNFTKIRSVVFLGKVANKQTDITWAITRHPQRT